MPEEYVRVAKASEIPVGQFKQVVVQGKPLLICHAECPSGTGFSAIDNTCTHDDGPLEDGWIEGCAIECPRHGARFDVRTGAVLALPAAVPIRAYPVTVEGDDVLVKLEA